MVSLLLGIGCVASGLFLIYLSQIVSKERKSNQELKSNNQDLLKRVSQLEQAFSPVFLNNQQLQLSVEAYQERSAKLSLENQRIRSEIPALIEKERAKAVESSRVITHGKVSEHIAPFLPDFKWKPSDCRFLGSPIDFIVFDGISENNIQNLVFIDVKTGNAALTDRQRQIRDCIKNNKMEFSVFRVN